MNSITVVDVERKSYGYRNMLRDRSNTLPTKLEEQGLLLMESAASVSDLRLDIRKIQETTVKINF